MTTGDGDSPAVKIVSVYDWPDAAMRFAQNWTGPFGAAKKLEVPFFKNILQKTLLHDRYNGIFFQLDDYYQWKCAPKMRRPMAWTEDDFREVVKFVNTNYLPAMPMVQSFGHMDWWLLGKNYGFDYLGEDGNPQVICTRNPDTYKTLFSFYDEIISICGENPEYQPRYFHSSIDEVNWRTASLPEEKRCVLCKGIPKNKIFLEHVKKLNEYIQSRNMAMIMFSDTISEAHNGLNDFQCALIRDQIPREVLIAHWSARDFPEIAAFADMGFTNLKYYTGYKADRLNEKYVHGYNLNLTTYNWWLTWNRDPIVTIYSPLAIKLFANSCWNLFPDDDNSSWRGYVKKYGNWFMRNWSRKPLPAGNGKFTTIDLAACANDSIYDQQAGDGHGWFDLGAEADISSLEIGKSNVNGIPTLFTRKNKEPMFVVFPKRQKESAAITVNAKAGSVIILHAAYLDQKDSGNDKARNRTNYSDPLTGLPIARYSMTYDDGATTEFSALYGWNVAQWQNNPLEMKSVFEQYVLDARSITTGKTKAAVSKNLPDDYALYQYEWVNPNPSKKIQSIKVESLGTYVSYGLLAMTVREARP